MNNVLKKIESIMTGKRKAGLISFESLLFVFSLIYGSAVKTREAFYNRGVLRSKKLPCIVISIGNITVGGTGKTPMTIHVAKLVKRMGYKVVVISRGYKGLAEKTGGIVSDGKTIFMKADKAGDEPFMIAGRLKSIPVVVGKNRFNAGMTALNSFNPDVIVLDDAYQHLRLKRDIDLVLVDNICPFGNNRLIPRGTLREPLSALMRGDAFILTRSDVAKEPESTYNSVKLKTYAGGKPVFKAIHVPYIYELVKGGAVSSQGIYGDSCTQGFEFLRGRSAFIFSGIARNIDFYNTVKGFNCRVTGWSEFADHHRYTDRDLDMILQSAKESNADFIITTEKDYARIANRIAWPIDLVVVGIKISFENYDNEFNLFIKNRLKGLGNK
ncbi:MAG: tetraacyldisaccharide 4'-kinase [Deltaproteobacteria bacterium]|nr:tetraacyldisaccharide 4'-kinase [Deltaproteobacteria bacterium]